MNSSAGCGRGAISTAPSPTSTASISSPGAPGDFRSAIPLEKAQTYIDAGIAARLPAKRDEYFVLAEQHLNEFLSAGSHPRQSQARLQLGKLQMVRAAQLADGEADDQQRADARNSYLAAAKTFDTIVEDLRGKIKSMQGAKINPDTEPEKAALRKKYQQEFLEGKVAAAESRRFAAKTFSKPAEQGKELLEQALREFTELSEDFSRYVPGAMAMLHRGQVQEDLGRADQALDSYVRMLEQPEADALRDSKFQAGTGMIRLWMANDPPNYKVAIERGQALLDGIRVNEKRSASVQALRVELAKAYLEKAEDTESLKPAERKRAQSSGRQLLIAASKVPSDSMRIAKDLLGSLGVEAAESVDLPADEPPAGVEDALAKARALLELSENVTESIKLMEEQGEKTADNDKQVAELKQQLRTTRGLAIRVLRQGLALTKRSDDIEVLNQARRFLAYLLYQNEDYRDAYVVGAFLARQAPGKEDGLSGGVIALNSLQLLFNEVPQNANDALLAELRSFGSYLSKTWPDDPRAAGAQGVMVRIAMTEGRWDEARELVEKMPQGAERANYQRLLGRWLWNRVIQAQQDSPSDPNQEIAQGLGDAANYLQVGLDGIPGKLVGPDSMEAALILVKVYLKLNQLPKATAVLENAEYGPSPLFDRQGHPDPDFATDLHRTELQLVVQSMMRPGGDREALLERATKVMTQLRESVQGDDAQQRLTSIFLSMATDIREQLDQVPAEQRGELVKAFRVFLDRVAETSNDVATLIWVGQTLMDLAEKTMQPTDVRARGVAAELLASAVKTFERLDTLSKDLPLVVHFQHGRANRLIGGYMKAANTLESLLKEKPNMLDAQIEAALVYEQWAANLKRQDWAAKAYESALNGARKNAQGKNTIWGWGIISQKTSGNPQYEDKFFDARFHVAFCRYKWGVSAQDKRLIQRAERDITQVATVYPKLGGKQKKQRFELLLKSIQKDLGKKQTGFAADK